MSTNLVTVMASTPMREAIPLFGKHGIHHLPVVEADRRLIGIFSQADLLGLLGESLDRINGLTVGEVMTGRLAKLEASDNVATAANLFLLNRFHSLPVVEGDKLVGIVTTLDLIKLIDQEEVELKDYKEM